MLLKLYNIYKKSSAGIIILLSRPECAQVAEKPAKVGCSSFGLKVAARKPESPQINGKLSSNLWLALQGSIRLL